MNDSPSQHTTHATPPPSPKPPRAPSAWLLTAILVVAIVLLITGAIVGYITRPRIEAALTAYHDVKQAVTGDETQPTLYTCGMHPWILLPEPGNCPICHMELTPIDPARFTGEVAIDPVVVQNMGVRTAPVTEGPLVRTIRTIGTVMHDETTVREVNLRFEGWIEKLYVDYAGQHVMEGDPLFDIYSPALYSAQSELLLARGNEELTRGARERLANFGVSDQQIDEILESGEASRTLRFASPFPGHVIAKNVFEGMKVAPGTALYRIADHRRVWVNVLVYESQLPYIEEGMEARMTVPYLPGKRFVGRVVFIQPHLEMDTRQLAVRLEFDNADLLLKPGMFADVELSRTLAEHATLVPREAVIDTGTRQVAFVSLGEGKFEPRQVRLGVSAADGMVQVVEGLTPGENVVTSGQFLIDSEARVREALAKMLAVEPADEADDEPAHDHDGMSMTEPTPGQQVKPYPLDVCLVTGLELGAMGEPIVRIYDGQELKFCCPLCPPKFEADPQTYLAKLQELANQLQAEE